MSTSNWSSRLLTLCCILCTWQKAFAQPFKPPPEPQVRPLIAWTYRNDTNFDRIDDQVFAKAKQTLALERAGTTAAARQRARQQLDQMIEVELIFSEQITQAQIDAFLAEGGEITYLYKAISFGWNGRLPLRQVEKVATRLGGQFLLMQESRLAKLHLQLATRTGRVRPVWSAGFAGSIAGFSGNTNITIAICDTGTDESHTDLNGRRVYWHDFSTDSAASPIDLRQHGSHVLGIATGTGAAGGIGGGALRFTDEATLTGVPNGSFLPSPLELPAGSVTVSLTSRWNGGGTTTLYLANHTKGIKDGYVSQDSVSGSSPLTLTTTFVASPDLEYTPALISRGSISDYVTTCQVSSFPGAGDGFNLLRGVAPGCKWGCAKVFTSSGTGLLSWTAAALDDLVAGRVTNNVKVINLSLGANGNPGLDPATRQKVNTAVNNGIVVVASAGNDGGAGEVDDPGRAAMALTVGAANDINQLTDYTSKGFVSPGSTSGQEEDYKPDLMAPGGSANYYSAMLSVDSNSGDGTPFSDQQANDYYSAEGTSMASPFAAGCAALVIEALEQTGTSWDFSSSQHARLVKMLLCATATESNTNREGNANNPTLQRDSPGPNSFPVGKDQYEGYGMINPDAAIDAVMQILSPGLTNMVSLGPNAFDRRAWARTVHLVAGQKFAATLAVPVTGDFDLYLYDWTPSSYGTPILLASSTQPGNGINEALSFLPGVTQSALLVVKRVSGSGEFDLVGHVPPIASFSAEPTNGVSSLSVLFTNLSSGNVSNLWSFGDGQTSSVATPLITYSNAGSYSVSLLVANPAGTNIFIRTNYIVVTNPPPPFVNFAADPTNGLPPLTVNFTNLTSGTGVAYAWTFGDGNGSVNPNPSNIYSNSGTYTVKLTAWNAGGSNSLTLTNLVVVTNLLPPVVDFAANLTSGVIPLGVDFTNLTTGPAAYFWSFGDGNISGLVNPSNMYSNAGEYSVTLTAWNSGGTNSLTRINYIAVTNPPPPVVDFVADPTNGLLPLVVGFTNLSTGTVNGHAWSFGDGNSSTADMPSNTYSNAGLFSVTLTAWNSGGTNSLTRTNYVVATNLPPPTAEFVGGPTNGLAPLIVGLTNLTTGSVSSYVWDFGDGTLSDLENPEYTYTNAGSYTISLTAVGQGGSNRITFTNYIVVTNPPPPAVNFIADITNGMAPLTVHFTNLTTGGVTYDWTFGDSNSSSAVDAVNTYTNAGVYSVTLTAIGAGGLSSLTLTNYVEVTNLPPPIVNFIADVTNGLAPLTISFANLTTGAIDYHWTFGDENSSSDANPLNTYTNAGVYSVTLTAIGPGGVTMVTLTNYVLVTNPPPPDVNFVVDYTNGVAPLSVVFTNLTAGAVAYEWILGDGNSTTNENPAHTYTNAGNYTITLTALGAGGSNSLTLSNFIMVLAPAKLVVTPDILDFGFILTGATGQAEFVLSNSGAINLSGMAAIPPGSFYFLDASSNVVSNSTFDIAPFNSTNIPVFFSSLTQASLSNVVVFASNGGDVTNALVGQALSPPVLLPSGQKGSDFIFSFLSLQGRTYVIQYKEFLAEPSWQNLESVPGNGSAVFITNPISTNGQRFFRLSLQ